MLFTVICGLLYLLRVEHGKERKGAKAGRQAVLEAEKKEEKFSAS
jgi:hypothetical protein